MDRLTIGRIACMLAKLITGVTVLLLIVVPLLAGWYIRRSIMWPFGGVLRISLWVFILGAPALAVTGLIAGYGDARTRSHSLLVLGVWALITAFILSLHP